MSGHEALIMVTVVFIIAAAGAFMMFQVGQDLQPIPNTNTDDTVIILKNVYGQNISNNTINHVRIHVATDGGVIDLNDTLLTLKTESNTAYLQYRNGTLERSVPSGFYTQ